MHCLLKTGFVAAFLGSAFAYAETERKIVELTQVPCQFLESENEVNHGYATTRKSDCKKINKQLGAERLEQSKTIVLEPGSYTFRVHNKGVPYNLGFWIRGDGVANRAKLPSVSGGGLKDGQFKDYDIDLIPGEYVYSCPLNPTLDYKLVVKG